MAIWSLNSNESLESLLFMISLKGSSTIIKYWDIHCSMPLDVQRMSACLVINPIMVYSYVPIDCGGV